MVRRLPVVQNQASDDEHAARRPSWQWLLIGTGLAITIWLPLLAVALWTSARLGAAASPGTPRIVAGVLPTLVAFAVATSASGALVGRFGGSTAERVALGSGGLTGVVACSLALLGGAGSVGLVAASAVILGLTGSVTAWVGARWGNRMRPRL